MKAKGSTLAQIPPGILHFLIHGNVGDTSVDGAFEAFQMLRDVNNFRRYWLKVRAEVLASHPDAWGRRFDSERGR